MKLIVQPDAGVAPIGTAIKQARKSVDVLIFRLDRLEIARLDNDPSQPENGTLQLVMLGGT